MCGFYLEDLYKELNKTKEEVRNNVEKVEKNLRMLRELILSISSLPKGLRPAIPENLVSEINGLDKDLVLENPAALISIYNEVASLLVSFLVTNKGLKCKDDLTRYHDTIVRCVSSVARKQRRLSETLIKTIEKLVEKNPCNIYEEVLKNIDNLYGVDEELRRFVKIFSKFLNMEQNVISFTISNYIWRSSDINDLIYDKSKHINSLTNNLTDLITSHDLSTYKDILSMPESWEKCELKVAHSLALHRKIKEVLSRLSNNVVVKHKDLEERAEREVISLSNLEDFLSIINEIQEFIDEINKFLSNYKEFTVRFLERMNESDLSSELKGYDLSIQKLNGNNLKNLCNALRKFDEELKKVLDKLMPNEKRVLEEVIEMLYENKEFSADLTKILNSLSDDHKEIFIKLCEKGVIQCWVGI